MWVDADDVEDLTGVQVSQRALLGAHLIVALIAGIPDTTDLGDTGIVSTTNARHLTTAVAVQAVWLDDHPDAFTAMDTTGVSADGVSAQYATRYAAFLAPLASLCINRLSWKRAAIRIRRQRLGPIQDTGNRDSAVRDDQYAWTPMGAGGALGARMGQVWSG